MVIQRRSKALMVTVVAIWIATLLWVADSGRLIHFEVEGFGSAVPTR